MMSACTMVLKGLLFLLLVLQNCQGTRIPEKTCQPGYYWNERCLECPSTCESCTSNTTCTLCKKGHYGQACLVKCDCKDGACDQVTGDCPQGCVQGRYGTECELPCPGCGACKTCDRNTGQCAKCLDNYFLHDGKCRLCSHGCSFCDTDSTCIRCGESYFLRDGRCERCMHGCRLCNTSNNCLLCNNDSIALFDGFCLSRCPANTTITTDHGLSTCEEHSYNYNYTESGFCQQKSNGFPFAEFKCIHQCNTSHDSSSCQSTCILHEMKQQQDLSRNQDREPAFKDQKCNTAEIAAATVFTCLLLTAIVIFTIRRIHTRSLTRNDIALSERGEGATRSSNINGLAGAQEPLLPADATDNRHSPYMNYNSSLDGDLHETMNENRMKVNNGTSPLRRRTRKSRKSRNGVKWNSI